MFFAKQQIGTDYFPATMFECIVCGVPVTFYSASPKACPKCGGVIPEFREMLLNPHYRVLFHRGKIVYAKP